MIRSIRAVVPAGALRVLLIEAVLIAGSLLLATYLLAWPDPDFFLFFENGFLRLGLVLATLLTTMQLLGLYSRQIRRLPRIFLIQELCLSVGITFIVEGLLASLNIGLRAPVRITVAGGMFAIVAIVVWRSTYGTLVWQTAERRVLFVGNSPALSEIAGYLGKQPDAGLRLAGYVGEPPADGREAPVKNLGQLAGLDEIVRAVHPDLVVLSLEGEDARMPVLKLIELRTAGFHIEDDSAFVEQVCGYCSSKALAPSSLVFSEAFRVRQSRLLEIADFAMAAAALLVSLPAMLAAAAAVKLSSAGPALRHEPCIGKDGAVFPLYRFPLPDGEGNPRAGRLVRLLRRYNVQHWPRLFNVLRGEMSIVGPRPERAEFTRRLTELMPFYPQRHAVRPGLTGWAQVRYREAPEDSLLRLQHDLYYIKYRSPLLNNYVILHGLVNLFRGRRQPRG